MSGPPPDDPASPPANGQPANTAASTESDIAGGAGSDPPSEPAAAPSDTAPESAPTEPPPTVEDLLTTLEQVTAERDQLTAALAEAQALAAERLDDFQRLGAEFQNFKRRTTEEKARSQAAGVAQLAEHVFLVLDACDNAVQQPADGGASGIAPIRDQLLGALERVGVKPIDALGQPFDPAEHEAVPGPDGPPPTDGSPSTVAGVLRTGYRTPDRILRPATVYVEATSQPAEPSTPDTNNQPPNATDPAAAPNPPADG